jgi:PBP1b-binding outer membrane lipoprotein LpoB
MKKLVLILPLLFILNGCSEQSYESRELPTKYPETPTMGSADDVTKELYKK